jgi:uncharacterized protein (DUF1800 family)
MLKRYEPNPQQPFNYARAAHLLRRAMIAPSHEEIKQAALDGIDTTVEKLFSPVQFNISYIDEWAGTYPRVAPIDDESYIKYYWANVKRVGMFYHWWLMNIRDSPVSLQERLVLFWHGHFATDVRMNIELAQHLYTQYSLLQKMCMGNFKEFVKQMTRNIAMQSCLSLHFNFVHEGKKYINENYAREMLELHTVGIYDENGNRNYSQKDVFEAARALTGWHNEPSPLGPEYISMYSRFIPERWDNSEKTFLGRIGNWDTDGLIDVLFEERSQQIAKWICAKLYSCFVADEPNKEIVHEMAATFISHNWELQPVLQELFRSEHFFNEENIGVLKKNHIEYIIGMVRQCNLQNIPDFRKEQDSYGDILIRLETWGQLMYNPPNVSGWLGKRDWVNLSAFPRRLQFAKEVIQNKLITISNPVPPAIYSFDIRKFALRFENINNPEQLALEFAQYLLPHIVSEEESKRFIEAILDGGKSYEWNIKDPTQRTDDRMIKCLDAIVSHPAFQLF